MFFRNLRDFRVAWAFLRDWWYFPPGQTTVLAIHQGLPCFFQAYPWWTKSLHHLDLITNYNCINPIFSSPCHLMIHQIYLLHWVGVDLNLYIYIYTYYVCILIISAYTSGYQHTALKWGLKIHHWAFVERRWRGGENNSMCIFWGRVKIESVAIFGSRYM